jgi:hypothetical protein
VVEERMIYVTQALVFLAFWFSNIYFGWMDNPYNVSASAAFLAMAVTIFPLKVLDWWRFRETRRAKYAEMKAAGLAFGWRRHLPGADARARRVAAQQASRNALPQ